MPRGRPLKNPNDYGTVVKLSGKRRNPFEVRVNTRMDERYYPVYDVLGRFPSREDALQNDVIEKGYASFVSITVEEDDNPGVPFTYDELLKLWQHQSEPWADVALIFIYSGWRISELNNMPVSDISLSEWIFKGGHKDLFRKRQNCPGSYSYTRYGRKAYCGQWQRTVYREWETHQQ